MVPNGKGQTLVKHDIALELRGLSSKWYRTIFPAIHDQQLKRLASSFTIVPMNGTRISEVKKLIDRNFIQICILLSPKR
ncbi:hypothetical protein BLA29_009970 [Euroglyphus maynei]|uniref:Uncharacterized protein n=1 Tax=Euroglyphus maynei TaxID=6958 RepID=A0A1Y3BTE7_EURMA|nr:hypothetical protein BLA29_009970 [Euroglyphus maynei]